MDKGRKWKDVINLAETLKIKAYYRLGESKTNLAKTYGLNINTITKILEDKKVVSEEEVSKMVEEIKNKTWEAVRLDYLDLTKCRTDSLLMLENKINKYIREDNPIDVKVLSKLANDVSKRSQVIKEPNKNDYNEYSDEELRRLEKELSGKIGERRKRVALNPGEVKENPAGEGEKTERQQAEVVSSS